MKTLARLINPTTIAFLEGYGKNGLIMTNFTIRVPCVHLEMIVTSNQPQAPGSSGVNGAISCYLSFPEDLNLLIFLGCFCIINFTFFTICKNEINYMSQFIIICSDCSNFWSFHIHVIPFIIFVQIRNKLISKDQFYF